MAAPDVAFLPLGAVIQSFHVASHNIVLGFPDPAHYPSEPYFGETIGRCANRIANAQFTLNGQVYRLHANNGPNHLHGGAAGWGTKVFDGPTPEVRDGRSAVKFRYVSADGEEGYPGTVEVRVWYFASHQEEAGVAKSVLEVEYEVELVGHECDETVVNVTNHSYFNLGDGPTIEGTTVTLHTATHLPVDASSIPLGTVTDFPSIKAGEPFLLGATAPDIDHCFTLDADPSALPLDTRSRRLRPLVTASHPSTNIHLSVDSTEPAFQFYTGRYIDVPATAETPARGPRAGFCVEPSRFVNAINVPEWRFQVILRRGQVWGARTVYKAWRGMAAGSL